MISTETEQIWGKYLESERIRVRAGSIDTLSHFIGALLQEPLEVWQPWARQLAHRIVDEHEEIPVRMPLFREVIFPALLHGLEQSVPGSARWLAGFAQLLYKSPLCRERLPENEQTECGLLLRAVRDDPDDFSSKKQLLKLRRSQFDYVLHELPWGVLYSSNAATIEECDELLVELSDYEQLATEIGSTDEDRELIDEARFHVPAYRRYLSCRGAYASYEQFLASGDEAGFRVPSKNEG